LREIDAVVRPAKPEPMFLRIANDPGGDERGRRHGGGPYKREVGESREAFWSRLRHIGCEKGAPIFFVGSGERVPPPTLEEPRQGETIENRGHGTRRSPARPLSKLKSPHRVSAKCTAAL
jgi:hypothetical protein